jgi:diguanylate cyclase (GGDEF)-like protein
VLLDIDHFTSINDRFGHNAGDEVLRSVAHAIASCGRSTDTIARWGGEEFIAILPTGVEGAHMFAERAREAVARIADDRLPYVTISAGVAECTSQDAADAALARADERLYTAKREGRNRVASTLEDFDLASVLARRITREILLKPTLDD